MRKFKNANLGAIQAAGAVLLIGITFAGLQVKQKTGDNMQQLQASEQKLAVDKIKTIIAMDKTGSVNFTETKGVGTETAQMLKDKILKNVKTNKELVGGLDKQASNIVVKGKNEFLADSDTDKQTTVSIPKINGSKKLIIQYLKDATQESDSLGYVDVTSYRNNFELNENRNVLTTSAKAIIKNTSIDSNAAVKEKSETFTRLKNLEKNGDFLGSLASFDEAISKLGGVGTYVYFDLGEIRKINKLTLSNVKKDNPHPIKKLRVTMSDGTEIVVQLQKDKIGEFKFPIIWTKEVKFEVLETY